MSTISLCMIVRNEEAVLARCLTSVKDAVDEIVIVDTGSSDGTREIAGEYTDRVYEFPWIDDFSAARNFSFSKATKDFILWLDADDILTEEAREGLLALKESELSRTDVVMLPYHTAFDELGNPTFTFYRERLIRRSIPFRWEGRVHEVIVHAGRVLWTDRAAVTHQSVKTSYSDRNLRIYEKQAAEEKLSPRDAFYYGRELCYHGKYERAKEVLTAFLVEGKGWVENNIEACRVLGACCRGTGDAHGAVRALLASFLYDAPRAEVCCDLGAIFLEEQRYRDAVFWYELALSRPAEEKSGAFVSADCHGYLPCIQLCVCYDRLGEWEKARKYNRLAGTYRPRSAAYLQNEKYFEKRFLNDLRESEYTDKEQKRFQNQEV